MREFSTSAAQATETRKAGDPITVKIDEREIVFDPPDDNLLVLMVAAFEASAQDVKLAASMTNTFFALIASDGDRMHLRGRLFDPDDHFGLETIADVIAYLLEQWSGNPTQSSPDSSSSPHTSGPTSRATHSGRAFHRGPSHSASGAPSSTGGSAVEPRATETHSTPSSES